MNTPGWERILERSLFRARPAYRLYCWAWAGLDLLYPPSCGGCDTPGTRWCTACQDNTLTIKHPLCEICGQSLPKAGRCPACTQQPPAYRGLRSWAIFGGPLRHAIHRLKYEGDLALGEALARPMIELLKNLAWKLDLVVPVPMSAGRRAQRGYNQAALLAWPVALGCSVAYKAAALRKVRDTRSQVGLNINERHQNVSGAYAAEARWVQGRSVLVVDDVTTSGATLQSCTGALLEAGAAQVYGLTLARAAHPVPVAEGQLETSLTEELLPQSW